MHFDQSESLICITKTGCQFQLNPRSGKLIKNYGVLGGSKGFRRLQVTKTLIITTTDDQKLHIFDKRSQKKIKVLDEKGSDIGCGAKSLKVTVDERYLFVGRHQNVILLDLENYEIVGKPWGAGFLEDDVYCLDLSADGKKLTVLDYFSMCYSIDVEASVEKGEMIAKELSNTFEHIEECCTMACVANNGLVVGTTENVLLQTDGRLYLQGEYKTQKDSRGIGINDVQAIGDGSKFLFSQHGTNGMVFLVDIKKSMPVRSYGKRHRGGIGGFCV